MLIDPLLETLTQPQMLALILPWLSKRSQGSEQDEYAMLEAHLNRIEAQLAPKKRGRPAKSGSDAPVTAAPPTVATGTPQSTLSLTAFRDQVMAASGALKEALRFAREDGIQHPEAQQRIQDARRMLIDQLAALERYDLAPERLQSLPPTERQVWEAALPTIRKLRQAGLNKLGTVDGLAETAALAGTLGVELQLGVAVTGATGPDWQPPPSASVPPAPTASGDGQPYSQYAPEMSVDTGCVECGRAHLAGVDAVLRRAAEEAQTKGATHPDVQARLAFAQEELAALFQYDWTDAKIAKNPPAERAALEQFRPQVEALWQAAKHATTPDAVQQVAQQAQAIRDAYDRALPATRAYHSLVTPGTPPPGGPETVRVRRERVWQLQEPTAAEVQADTRPVNVAQAYDQLAAAVESCGVPVRYRALPATPDYILEGQYDPAANTIQLAPAALAKDSYAVQTLAHEALHSLLQNPACLSHPPADHSTVERQVEDGVIAVMIQSGLPIETRDGQLIDPGGRQVNWSAIEAEWGPDTAQNLRWATDWVVRALQGQMPVCETCPIPQEVT